MPISKLELFRDMFKENALRITGRSHVLEEEKSCIKDEIKGKHLLIYDETRLWGSPSSHCSLCGGMGYPTDINPIGISC